MDGKPENLKGTSVETIFHAAMGIASEAREAYLKSACGCDQGLYERVAALLRAHAASGGFLPEDSSRVSMLNALSGPDLPLQAGEKPGDKIGRYKLLQSIGEGGCGVVYMADQEEPVRRRVALKVIKLGMDTKQVVARFEAERQALALMDHANIAKVLDAGATETGRPFFVMELVRGVKLTEYCDQSRLSTNERLELFVQVCRAIEHAHQKGIIHRDIKPSNVLVTLHDGVPVPKVIDFGIAKATQGRLTDQTLFTAFEQFIGTPAYMSPEQAEMSGLDVDTRSDIYSLGVLLYELLTGKTPFDPKELMASGIEGMRHTIRETEPTRPSTMLSTMVAGELATAARYRRIDAPKLISAIKGDLEWIVMKCLEKDRTRRYETASALAADVLRYIRNEAVLARPPSRVYLFQKLVRRHKLAFASAGAIGAAVLLGLGLSTWFWFQERAARTRAVAAEKASEAEARKSRQVAELLKKMLRGAGPAVARGRDTGVLREILTNAVIEITPTLRGQNEVEAELLSTIGLVYLQLAEYDNAVDKLGRALQLRVEALGVTNSLVAQSYSDLSAAFAEQGNPEEAEKLQRRALEIRESIQPQNQRDIARSYHALGQLLAAQQRPGEAERLFETALDIRQREFPGDNPEIAESLADVGLILSNSGKWEQAEMKLNAALVMSRRLYPEPSPNVAFLLDNLSKLLLGHSKDLEAERTAKEALNMRLKLYEDGHPLVADSRTTLAQVFFAQHKLSEAEQEARQALIIQKTRAPSEHPGLADTLDVLMSILLPQHREAELQELFKDVPTTTKGAGRRTSEVISMHGLFLARTHRWKEAAADYERLVALHPDNHDYYHHLAALCVQTGNTNRYFELCATIRNRFGGITNDASIADRMAKDCLILPSPEVDRTVECRLADVALSRGQGAYGERWFQLCKGLAEYRQDHYQGAKQWVTKALEGENSNALRDIEASMVLAMANFQLGDKAAAQAAFDKGKLISAQNPPDFSQSQHSFIDWIIGEALTREAATMLSGAAPTDRPVQ